MGKSVMHPLFKISVALMCVSATISVIVGLFCLTLNIFGIQQIGYFTNIKSSIPIYSLATDTIETVTEYFLLVAVGFGVSAFGASFIKS